MSGTVTNDIHGMMEQASTALANRDYLPCEQLCLTSLHCAREQQDFDSYARILLPLQEARRQRRIIAAEGVLRIGTQSLEPVAMERTITDLQAGGIVLTQPCTHEQAYTLLQQARAQQRFIELLYAEVDDKGWHVQPCEMGEMERVTCPPPVVSDRWLEPGDDEAARWLLKACEAIGDAALATIEAMDVSDIERLNLLEQAVHHAGDHELLHQALGRVAQSLARQTKTVSATG